MLVVHTSSLAHRLPQAPQLDEAACAAGVVTGSGARR